MIPFFSNDLPRSVRGGSDTWDDGAAGVILTGEAFQQPSVSISYLKITQATGTIAGIMVYNGTTWAEKPVKAWDGAAWVTKPLKRYNGTTWV